MGAMTDGSPLSRLAGISARAAWLLLVLVLALAPLPYGANRPLAWSLLALTVAVAALLAGLGGLLRRERAGTPLAAFAAAAAVVLVAVWAALQGAPGLLPPSWEHPLWREVRAMGLPALSAVSLSPERSLDNLMRLLAYLAVGVLAFGFGRDPARARSLLHLLLAIVTLEAAYGLVRLFAGLDVVPWVADGPGPSGTLSGSFVNRNHAATYLGLGFLAALGLLTERLAPSLRESHHRGLLRELLDGLFGRRWYAPVLLILLGTAVLLTGSRGGFMSLLVATVFFLFMVYLTTRPGRLPALTATALLIATGWLLLSLGGEPVLERLLATEELDAGRLQIYDLALRMAADRPWLGHGYGGFEQVFMLYRDARFDLVFDRAHDTYLEHAVELGLPATLLLYAGMAVLFVYSLAGVFRRRRDRIFPLLAASATVLVGIHALVDFSIQIPAVAVTYAAILGLGAAQATPRRSRQQEATGRGGAPRSGVSRPSSAPRSR